MSQGIHLVNVSGYGPSDGNCLPCYGVTGRAVGISPCSCQSDSKRISPGKIIYLKCAFRSTSFFCNASSGGYRRNPDFSRLNKHGFSRSRNRPFEERGGFDNLEESEILSSKNGPLLSASGTPKFQATATPGPRKKEIVELFRKVQAKLQDRAPIKEEKKNEDLQGQSKQNQTVDSLLKLLRKHSVQQGKRSNSTSSNWDFILDQPEPNGSFSTEKSLAFISINNKMQNKVQESGAISVSRPTSSYQRRPPVPQIKKLPIYPVEDTVNSIPRTNSEGKQKETDPELEGDHEPKLKFKVEPEPEPEPKFKLKPEPEAEPEPEPILSNADMLDEMSGDETSEADEGNSDDDADEQNTSEHTDLSGMKLTALRALAKSRGMKGFSKLKKGELMELLTEV